MLPQRAEVHENFHSLARRSVIAWNEREKSKVRFGNRRLTGARAALRLKLKVVGNCCINSKCLTHQKKILSVLAMRSARQTWRLKPSAFCVRTICRYCGTYGRIPGMWRSFNEITFAVPSLIDVLERDNLPPQIIAAAAKCPRTLPTVSLYSSLMIQSMTGLFYRTITTAFYTYFFLFSTLFECVFLSLSLSGRGISVSFTETERAGNSKMKSSSNYFHSLIIFFSWFFSHSLLRLERETRRKYYNECKKKK